MSNNLERLKAEYLYARENARIYADTVKPLTDELNRQKETLETNFREGNAEMLAENDRLQKRADEAEAELRVAIVEEYAAVVAADPNAKKTIGEGLSVQVRTKFTITDEAAAIKWARENAPILIKEAVDAKELEKIAKGKDLEFVQVTEIVSAVIKA